MRIHILIVFVGACLCAGCSESRAERPEYVPPPTISGTEESTPVDPFERFKDQVASRYEADCRCERCDCDPCECGDAANSPPRSDAMRPGYRLSLLTAQWCVNCPASKSAAYEASVPVEIVDVDMDDGRAAELWEPYPYKHSLPMWVLSRDGRPLKYWTGVTDAAGVEQMAAFDPAAHAAQSPPVRIQRQPSRPMFVPQPRYQYQQPRRGPIRRFFGGGCANGRCG